MGRDGLSSRNALPLQGLTVLIVEDQADSLDTTRLMVEGLGARVFVGLGARQAVATLEGTPFDVVLCDLRMPGMDGFELNARIRHDPRWQHIPVIAITGLDSQADYHRTLEAGFAGHVVKPIDVEVLCSTIQKATRSAAA